MGPKSYRDDLRTPMTFFNIGPSSGASLKMLHAQTYVTPYAAGLLTYTFNEAFRAMEHCITCKIANEGTITDPLEQTIDLSELIIWEDEYTRLHVPFAPIRPLSVRIQIKRHASHLGQLTDKELYSLGKALALGHKVILHSSPPNWPIKQDRTLAFRQTRDRDDDFHMFIDILPTIPLGGAEVIDSLSVTSIDPYRIAQRMKSVLTQIG
jgi:galactose-1-phosphate uridylyltransferase